MKIGITYFSSSIIAIKLVRDVIKCNAIIYLTANIIEIKPKIKKSEIIRFLVTISYQFYQIIKFSWKKYN